VARDRQEVRYQVDLRYAGQSADISVTMSPEDFHAEGLTPATDRFDDLHEQMFNFRLSKAKEIVNLRVIVLGPGAEAVELHLEEGDGDPSRAAVAATQIYSDGETHEGTIYDRSKLLAGDRIEGPAIITEVDSTTLVLPGSHATVDSVGNLLIRDNS